jgi:hypothetical protein
MVGAWWITILIRPTLVNLRETIPEKSQLLPLDRKSRSVDASPVVATADEDLEKNPRA